MKRTRPRTETWRTPQVKWDEGEMCGGMATADVQDERYKLNHCSQREEMPIQVERRWSRMEWSRVSKTADRSSRQRQEICYLEIALDGWSCRKSNVVLVE